MHTPSIGFIRSLASAFLFLGCTGGGDRVMSGVATQGAAGARTHEDPPDASAFDAGNASDAGEQRSALTCVSARRYRDCCAQLLAVSLEELASDPCLIPSQVSFPGNVHCMVESCDTTHCLAASETRVAVEDGQGTCVLADECQVDADCEIAAGGRGGGCSPRAIPVGLAERCDEDPRFCADCSAVDCGGPCGERDARCVMGAGGFKVCRGEPVSE